MVKITLLRASVFALGCAFLLSNVAHAASTYGASAPSNTVASPKVVSVASSQAASIVSGRVSSAVSNATGNAAGAAGLPHATMLVNGNSKAAGDPARNLAVWASASGTWLSSDQTGADFSGTVATSNVGIDYMFNDKVLSGLAVGYERPDITTGTNSGSIKGNNFMVAPYVAYIINNIFSVDALVGYTRARYDMSRNSGAVTGSTDGNREFGAVNISANKTIDRWRLGSSLGYLYTKETQDDYTESNGSAVNETKVRLGQARLTGKAGYSIMENWGTFTPYGSVRFEYDANHTAASVIDAVGTLSSNSRFGTTFGVGVDAAIGNNSTVSLGGTTTQFRENLSVYDVSGSVRLKF